MWFNSWFLTNHWINSWFSTNHGINSWFYPKNGIISWFYPNHGINSWFYPNHGIQQLILTNKQPISSQSCDSTAKFNLFSDQQSKDQLFNIWYDMSRDQQVGISCLTADLKRHVIQHKPWIYYPVINLYKYYTIIELFLCYTP